VKPLMDILLSESNFMGNLGIQIVNKVMHALVLALYFS
jgi:hypothetical protein